MAMLPKAVSENNLGLFSQPSPVSGFHEYDIAHRKPAILCIILYSV